jgi:hypothetical protein
MLWRPVEKVLLECDAVETSRKILLECDAVETSRKSSFGM